MDPSVSLILLVCLSLTAVPLSRFGTSEQQNRFVPAMARGEAIGAYCLTEPNAGSDAGSISTSAVLKDGRYVLNGRKVFITNGDVADIYLVFANLDKSRGQKGITGFIVERGNPGLTAIQQREKLGMRASSTAEVLFEDCLIPEANRIGDEFNGFKIALQILDASRPVIGAQAVGIAQGALDLALRHVRQRQQFGQPLANFQGLQWMLADMATQIDAARLLVHRSANLHDKKLPFAKEASMAKLFASETATKVAGDALQLHGGYGYFKDSPIERFFRDSKVTEIYEGTSQIQRLVIARHILREVAG